MTEVTRMRWLVFQDILLKVTLSFSDASDISREPSFAHHSRSNPEATIFTYVHYRGIKNLFRRRFYLTGYLKQKRKEKDAIIEICR